jgi:hypothetical protein
VNPCDKQIKGDHGECVQYRLDERPASRTMLLGGPVNSVQQLGSRDGRYRDLVIHAKAILQTLTDSLHRTLGSQCTRGPLELYEYRGV